MAYGKGYKKTKKKSNTRRKTSFKRRGYLIPKNPQYTITGVVRKTHKVNLCYREQFAMTSSFGFPAYNHFLLNSIYDPNYTGGGHQPLGHDQWASFYKKYKVIGAKITARFMWNSSSTVGQIHRVGIIFDKDATPSSVPAELIEKTHSKCTKILHSNSRDSQTVTCYYSGRKAFGKEFDDHNHSAAFGSSPTTPMFASVYAFTVDGGTSTDDLRVEVILEQLCELSDPVDIALS